MRTKLLASSRRWNMGRYVRDDDDQWTGVYFILCLFMLTFDKMRILR